MMRAWATGLAAGLVIGLGTLAAGYLAALLGLVAIVALIRRPRRDATAAGLLLGLGGSWTLLLLRADLACGVDCLGPDLTGWYAIGAALTLLGAILSVRVVRSATIRTG